MSTSSFRSGAGLHLFVKTDAVVPPEAIRDGIDTIERFFSTWAFRPLNVPQ
jgi:hypothetical protein